MYSSRCKLQQRMSVARRPCQAAAIAPGQRQRPPPDHAGLVTPGPADVFLAMLARRANASSRVLFISGASPARGSLARLPAVLAAQSSACPRAAPYQRCRIEDDIARAKRSCALFQRVWRRRTSSDTMAPAWLLLPGVSAHKFTATILKASAWPSRRVTRGTAAARSSRLESPTSHARCSARTCTPQRSQRAPSPH